MEQLYIAFVILYTTWAYSLTFRGVSVTLGDDIMMHQGCPISCYTDVHYPGTWAMALH